MLADGSGTIDLYEVLQVDRRADPDVIRAAYRALARRYHPDFGGSPSRMASINEAWSVLGDAARRAAYDAEPQAIGDRPGGVAAAPATDAAQPAAGEPVRPADGHGLSGRRPAQAHAGGTVLDFGRYAGWTVGSLADHDPDYLEWLGRTPIGRHLSAEIDAALARRTAELAAHRPADPQPRRRAFL